MFVNIVGVQEGHDQPVVVVPRESVLCELNLTEYDHSAHDEDDGYRELEHDEDLSGYGGGGACAEESFEHLYGAE